MTVEERLITPAKQNTTMKIRIIQIPCWARLNWKLWLACAPFHLSQATIKTKRKLFLKREHFLYIFSPRFLSNKCLWNFKNGIPSDNLSQFTPHHTIHIIRVWLIFYKIRCFFSVLVFSEAITINIQLILLLWKCWCEVISFIFDKYCQQKKRMRRCVRWWR